MQNFYDTFETRKRSLISALSICMTLPFILAGEGARLLIFRFLDIFPTSKGLIKTPPNVFINFQIFQMGKSFSYQVYFSGTKLYFILNQCAESDIVLT